LKVLTAGEYENQRFSNFHQTIKFEKTFINGDSI